MEIEPIYNVKPRKVKPCPMCNKMPVWGTDSFECPECQLGRGMKLWSLDRWNRMLKDKEQADKRRRGRRINLCHN